MALTPFAMNASPWAVDLLYRIAPGRISRGREEPEAEREEELSDHIIIPGYGITGKSVARAATIAGIPYMVIELNPEIIRQERSTFRPNFMFGDAVQAEVLEHAGIRRARTLIIVVSEEDAIPRIIHTARQLAPDLHILARTRHVRNARYLLEQGADEIISEEFEAALEIFSRTLKKYSFRTKRSATSSNGPKKWVPPSSRRVPMARRGWKIQRSSSTIGTCTHSASNPGLALKERPSANWDSPPVLASRRSGFAAKEKPHERSSLPVRCRQERSSSRS